MSDTAIRATGLSKAYRIWENPASRLQSIGLHAVKQLFPQLWDRCTAAQARRFHDFYALRNVSVELRRGETLGIIGRNGSGKSTLLQIIAGTLAPTNGSVDVNGRVAALLELGSGFNRDFTGRENVFLNGAVLGLSESEVSERFGAIAAFAEIGDFIERPVRTYSSGMVLRLAFAVIAHVQPDILIVDEALAVGDAFFVQKCMRWIRDFKKRGTLLFVAHNTAEVVALCDRVIWLKDGEVALDGSARRVTEEYHAYFHATQASRRPPAPAAVAPRSVAGAPALDGTRAFSFDLKNTGFGEGKGRITAAEFFLTGDAGTTLFSVVGGERVTLRIAAKAIAELVRPILGFYLKDRLGQQLFGDNTFLSNQSRELLVSAGDEIVAEFTFVMPALPRGSYVFALALATGTQAAHVQQHWIHDAIKVESVSPHVHHGLVGIPMERIFTSVASHPNAQPASSILNA